MESVPVRTKGRIDPQDSRSSSIRELGGLLIVVHNGRERLGDRQGKQFAAQGWDALKDKPFYEVLWKHREVFPHEVPSRLPADRGIRHEIDLELGTKYRVTRQWPLPKEKVDYSDEFFDKRDKARHVCESNSPYCSLTFCVCKATGGWRVDHAYNTINTATIPAQKPIPRKDVH